MTYLTYEPAFDAYHTAYRMVLLSRLLRPDTPLTVPAFRIADFYFTFPFLLQDVRLKREHQWIRGVSRAFDIDRPYAHLPDSPLLFDSMEVIQSAAVQTLALNQFFEMESLERSYVVLVDAGRSAIDQAFDVKQMAENDELLSAISTLLWDYPLLGPDGLKARTKLMEYRYDAV